MAKKLMGGGDFFRTAEMRLCCSEIGEIFLKERVDCSLG
jgi:hypothetical protein